MYIAIDFDGTCVKHEFPEIGKDIGAVPVLEELVANGHQLILFTMRSDDRKDGVNVLTPAVNWFKERRIPLYGIQRNPSQSAWTSSPKAYAHIYIDDAALGCPLLHPANGKPYVNWVEVRKMLIHKGLIKI